MRAIDYIYDLLKDELWFKNMSMDAQGKFCMKIISAASIPNFMDSLILARERGVERMITQEEKC